MSIELLEARIAPAAVIINAQLKTAVWTDYDGDTVTLKYSTNAPTFLTTDAGQGLRVDEIGLTPANNSMESFKLTVKAGPQGDGRVDIGRVNATGVGLDTWFSPAATIAEFDAGNGDVAVRSLTTGTLGALNVDAFTKDTGNGISSLVGSISTMLVKGDIGANPVFLSLQGKTKSITVTGSLRGGDAPAMDRASGLLNIAGGNIAKVSIGGSILGGDRAEDGSLKITGTLGVLEIGGSVLGGSAPSTGVVSAPAKTVKIGGDVVGGSFVGTGLLNLGSLKTLTIGGNIAGGEEASTGTVNFMSADMVTVKGSIMGHSGTKASATGFVGGLCATGDVDVLKIGRDLVAGSFESGTLQAYNGAVIVDGNLGSVTIGGSIQGTNDTMATIIAKGENSLSAGGPKAIGNLTVKGSVAYAYIAAGQAFDKTTFADRIGTAENPDACIGRVTVGGDWFHSNLTAGINDSGSNGFSTADTQSGGATPELATIGAVKIAGRILDNPASSGFSGFGADKIASITAGGVKVFQTGGNSRSLDAAGFVDVAEYSK